MLGLAHGDLLEYHMSAVGHPPDLKLTRVSLNCSVYRHHQHWEYDILPAVQTFVKALKVMRVDECLRYRWLLLTLPDTTDAERDSFIQELLGDLC